MKAHVEGFMKSHPVARFIRKSGRIYAEVERPVFRAGDALREFFRSFASTKSHLAFHEEMLIIERLGAPPARISRPGKAKAKPARPRAMARKKPRAHARRPKAKPKPRARTGKRKR
jgi:hypothetical protein